jgi:hypothetical protein
MLNEECRMRNPEARIQNGDEGLGGAPVSLLDSGF